MDCEHRVVHVDDNGQHQCTSCAMPFWPDTHMENTLATLAWVIDRIAKMNGVDSAVVDGQVRAATQETEEHVHVINPETGYCAKHDCNFTPFLDTGANSGG